MVRIPLSALSLPLLLTLWALDSYLFVLALRLLAGRCPQWVSPGVMSGLRSLVDPLPRRVARWLSHQSTRSYPPWCPWVITGVALWLLRYVLLAVLTLGLCAA